MAAFAPTWSIDTEKNNNNKSGNGIIHFSWLEELMQDKSYSLLKTSTTAHLDKKRMILSKFHVGKCPKYSHLYSLNYDYKIASTSNA